MARIVIITSRFPYPLEKGDKLRIYHQILFLAKHHDVNLIAINETPPKPEDLLQFQSLTSVKVFTIPLIKRIFNLFLFFLNKRPLQVQYFYSSATKKKITTYIREIKPDVIYSHLIRTSEYVKDFPVHRKTIDYMDCFSKGFELKIKNSSNHFLTWLYRFEYKRLIAYENHIYPYFHQHIIISEQDKLSFNPVLEKMHVIPNGVDFSLYKPSNAEKKYDLLFSGNMGYPPNRDAANFAATQVLPLLLKKDPNIKLLIAGVNPPKKLLKLQSRNIYVEGKFSHISEAYAQCLINIVPVITSIGLQNKVLQSMAMKMPTVVTPEAAKGINAQHANVLLIGSSPEELAAHISTLLEDPLARNNLAERAFEFIHQNFSWSAHNENLMQIITK